jgi:hypothetical protein
MARTTMTIACPHCEAEVEVRIETQAALALPLKLPFATGEELAQWLKASGFSIDEFRRLPFYEWHRDQLEPLTRAPSIEEADDETAEEWHRDQVEPLTRALADEAKDITANTAPGLGELSDALGLRPFRKIDPPVEPH